MGDVRTVIDTDAHYWEPLDEMAEYMAEPWRTKVLEHPGGISSIKKRWLPSSSGDRSMAGRIRRDETPQRSGGMSSEDIPKAMEYVGVDVAILLSQLMLASGKIVDEERIVVLANAYTDYMLETVVDPNEGIYTMVPVPYQDPDEAVDLIDHVGREKGIVAACMITSWAEPPLGHRRYDRVYQAIRDAGLPVVFHGGGSGIDQFYIKG